MADDSPRRLAKFDQWHSDRRDPASLAHCGRDGAGDVHGRGLLQGDQGRRCLRLRFVRPMHGALDAPIHGLDASARHARGVALRHGGGFAWDRARGQRPCNCLPRLPALAQEMVMAAKKIEVANLRITYGAHEALKGVTFDVYQNKILAVIGPAQSGKTSLLKALNRTLEGAANARVAGTVKVDGEDISRVKSVHELRRKIGMVAPLPVGLPMTIYDNVAFAPRMAGLRNRGALDELVERCLRQAGLWDEGKARLAHHLAGTLSSQRAAEKVFAPSGRPTGGPMNT